MAWRDEPLLEGWDGSEDHCLEWRVGSRLGGLLGLDDLGNDRSGSSISHCVIVGLVLGSNCLVWTSVASMYPVEDRIEIGSTRLPDQHSPNLCFLSGFKLHLEAVVN